MLKPFTDTPRETIHTAFENREVYALETLGMFVGPVPVEEFLEGQLPLEESDSEDQARGYPSVDFRSVPTGRRTIESAMYAPLVRITAIYCI